MNIVVQQTLDKVVNICQYESVAVPRIGDRLTVLISGKPRTYKVIQVEWLAETNTVILQVH